MIVHGDSAGSSGDPHAVVILLDSLNRHDLGCYGGTDFETPNIDWFAAERATRFTRHVTGSLPCMPARHDILTGSLDFLWRPWGSLELWDQPITAHSGRPASRRCWSLITPISSKPAVRTTTPTSGDGTTCVATRVTCGEPRRTFRGLATLPARPFPPPHRRIRLPRAVRASDARSAADRPRRTASTRGPTHAARAEVRASACQRSRDGTSSNTDDRVPSSDVASSVVGEVSMMRFSRRSTMSHAYAEPAPQR